MNIMDAKTFEETYKVGDFISVTLIIKPHFDSKILTRVRNKDIVNTTKTLVGLIEEVKPPSRGSFGYIIGKIVLKPEEGEYGSYTHVNKFRYSHDPRSNSYIPPENIKIL
jgi:hypothetical protein